MVAALPSAGAKGRRDVLAVRALCLQGVSDTRSGLPSFRSAAATPAGPPGSRPETAVRPVSRRRFGPPSRAAARRQLDVDAEGGQGSGPVDLDAIFGHLGKPMQDGLQRTRIDVVAAQHDHVIDPAADAAVEPRPGAAARTRLRSRRTPGRRCDNATADCRAGRSLVTTSSPGSAGRHGLLGRRVDHLRSEISLQGCRCRPPGLRDIRCRRDRFRSCR